MTNSVAFESEVLDKDIIMSGNLSGVFNVSINKEILIRILPYIKFNRMESLRYSPLTLLGQLCEEQ